jgi:hypothetical protein
MVQILGSGKIGHLTRMCLSPKTSGIFEKHAGWPGLIINRVERKARLKPTLTQTAYRSTRDYAADFRSVIGRFI